MPNFDNSEDSNYDFRNLFYGRSLQNALIDTAIEPGAIQSVSLPVRFAVQSLVFSPLACVVMRE